MAPTPLSKLPGMHGSPTPPRSRTPLVVGIIAAIACLGLALLVVVGLVVGGVLYTSGRTDQEVPAGSGSSTGDLVLPPGVDADAPYLELSTAADGPVVDVYVDFLCPHCATFHDAQGADLQLLAEDGEITLRLHPRPMLDPNSSPAGYSSRAANAAICAYSEDADPTAWFAAETALFDSQPGESGLTDEELTDLVGEAAGADVSSCVDEGTYIPWVQQVVEPEARESTAGTPAVLINGEDFTGDAAEAGSLKEAIEAA